MDTTLRIDETVIESLRLARLEFGIATRRPLNSNSETIAALIEYWDSNKRDTHGIATPPVLAPPGQVSSQGSPV